MREAREKRAEGEVKNEYRQEVDTNVVAINFKVLKEQGELATGDPIFCSSCQALFNKYSLAKGDEEVKHEELKEHEQLWVCEFCNNKNVIQVDEEEIPKTNAVNYILEAVEKGAGKQVGEEDFSVVFCVDVSGSMCVSKAIKGKH